MPQIPITDREFGLIADELRVHAQQRPDHPAVIRDEQVLTYRELDLLADRVAASLQRDYVRSGETIAICGTARVEYVGVFLGALRAGVVVAPLAPSSTRENLIAMLGDCGARHFFIDAGVAAVLGDGIPTGTTVIALDGSEAGETLTNWLMPAGAQPAPVGIAPAAPFNIIYSSGTTGTPKGIVQSHRMRWAHVRRAADSGYDETAVTLCSTPLYSNTTLVSFFPALAGGGTIVLMSKFDVLRFLALAQKHRATHAMLVPVQYQRIMDQPDFDSYDLSNFRMKFCTSAPFPAALKADVLKRWPGGLKEYYGLTEGGGTCILSAHEFPDKLHTVGKPAEGHDIRLIDENGNEVPAGEIGEVVGRSPAALMNGYHGQPDKTEQAFWRDKDGNRYMRTGDVGRFDSDGFLTLMDRKKDMIISGGFNIYPSDLEAVLMQHPAVKEAAVIGVPSRQWGETPVALVVLKDGSSAPGEEIRAWVNERVGKTQRLSALEIETSLPRSAIGKVLKRELRERYSVAARAHGVHRG